MGGWVVEVWRGRTEGPRSAEEREVVVRYCCDGRRLGISREAVRQVVHKLDCILDG